MKILHPSIFQYMPLFMASLCIYFGRFFGFSWPSLSLVFLFVLLMVWLWAATHRFFHKYEFHSDRMVCSSGILNRKSISILYANVQDVSVAQNPFQSIFNIGNVLVDTSGKDGFEAVLLGVTGPDDVASRIYKRAKPDQGDLE